MNMTPPLRYVDMHVQCVNIYAFLLQPSPHCVYFGGGGGGGAMIISSVKVVLTRSSSLSVKDTKQVSNVLVTPCWLSRRLSLFR